MINGLTGWNVSAGADTVITMLVEHGLRRALKILLLYPLGRLTESPSETARRPAEASLMNSDNLILQNQLIIQSLLHCSN